MNWLGGFKKVTHVIGVGIAGAAGWAITHPDIVAAVVRAYPKTAVLGTAAGLIAANYRSPKA